MGKNARVNVLTAGLAATAATLWLAFLRHAGPVLRGGHIPWIALVGAFAFAEIFVVHVHVRRNTESFSLSELALVLGLFFAAPHAVLTAQLVGAGAALTLHRKSPAIKVAFNLAQFSLTTAIAELIIRLAPASHAPLSAPQTGIAYLATLCAALAGVAAVIAAISLAEQMPSRRVISRLVSSGVIVAAANTSIALAGVALIRTQHWLVSLLVVPAITLYAAYRAYTHEHSHHESLRMLYEATRGLHESTEMDDAIGRILEQACQTFRAESAEVILFADDAQPPLRWSVRSDHGTIAAVPIALDPAQGVWARVAAEADIVVLPKPISSERLRAYYASQGIRDLMAAPIRTQDQVTGILTIGNRVGDVSTFGEADVAMFHTYANHVSVSIQNTRLVRQLRDALAHQTQLNRMKDEFVSTVSHELRTPLTAVQGLVKTLLRMNGGDDPEQRKDFLSRIDRQSDNLRDLIEDLLLTSRIDAGTVGVSPTPVDLRGLLDDVIGVTAPGSSQHPVDVQCDGIPSHVLTDESTLRRILTNLVGNAVRHTPAGTPIYVHAQYGPKGISITVADDGPGIPESAREHIFERFYQADQSTTRRANGVGLGLYIAHSLAVALGGELELEPTSGGATFRLSLPAPSTMHTLPSPPGDLPASASLN